LVHSYNSYSIDGATTPITDQVNQNTSDISTLQTSDAAQDSSISSIQSNITTLQADVFSLFGETVTQASH
jgi:hypothetical protein